jgi:hypothetical protein
MNQPTGFQTLNTPSHTPHTVQLQNSCALDTVAQHGDLACCCRDAATQAQRQHAPDRKGVT